MQVSFFSPMLTERDPVDSTEGGIDPLGTEPLADALGVRLAPGVRERQRHPRFLTAIAVSLEICQDLDEEAVGIVGSPPWLVFEWYMVEGLVRTLDWERRIGLPGSMKAARAIADGVPLSARRYLKTPTVFGFHGIYRQLARILGIEDDGRLGEVGYELLNIWAKERGLEGFTGSASGPGTAIRAQIAGAVQDGLEKGATVRKAGWSGWEFFRDHLAPYEAGPRESEFISTLLRGDPTGFRRDVLECLVSEHGREAWQQNFSEREFHRTLRETAPEELKTLLDAIDAYEAFSRLCHNAFQDCLWEMTQFGGMKTPPSALAKLQSVKRAAEEVPTQFGKASERLEPLGETLRFQQTFAGLAEVGIAIDWVHRLLEHHRRTQSLKPPNGKQPWFERFDDGGLMIRPNYRTEEHGTDDDSYAHFYRTRSLWQFALDLKLVQP